jgi:DNA-binding transcriptional regulator YiaG
MAIKEAIARGARRQVRGALTPLRRDVRRLRQSVRDLRVQLDRLRDIASRWEASASSQGWQPAVSEEEAQAARLSPGLIRKLRGRLRLSQAAVARLVGVSPAAVVQWEQGRSAPAGKNRAMLVGLRRLGRRQIRRILASLPDGAAPGRPAGRGRKARGAGRRTRGGGRSGRPGRRARV